MTKIILLDKNNKELFSKKADQFKRAEMIKRIRQSEGEIEIFSIEKGIGSEPDLQKYNTLTSGIIKFVDEKKQITKSLKITGIDKYQISPDRSGELVENLSFEGIIE